MMGALLSPESAVFTRATWRNILGKAFFLVEQISKPKWGRIIRCINEALIELCAVLENTIRKGHPGNIGLLF
jgi:hypothetical protein